MKNFYEILGVQDSDDFHTVKQAYFTYLRKVHPDKNDGSSDSAECVGIASVIWTTLKNSSKRAQYDRWLREQKLREAKGTIAETIELEGNEDFIEEPCRCGDYFQVSSEDLTNVVDRGIFECGSCSLCLEIIRVEMTSTKVVIMGESGVGKTSFCNAVSGKPGSAFPSTIGVSINMAWHDYRAGTSEQCHELIELWDIGGSNSHRNASQVLLEAAAGAILIHDLTNKKSEENLAQWLSLIDGKVRPPGCRSITADIESCHIPVLIVGCKSDLAPHRTPTAYDRINVDCRKAIPPGSSTSMALARFFDATIDRTRVPTYEKRKRIMSPY